MGIAPVNASKTVATAGTRVQFTTSAIYCTSIYVEALGGNTGYIYVGGSNVSSTVYIARLGAGQGITFAIDGDPKASAATGGNEYNLNFLYLDSSVSGEKALVTYQQRVGVS